MKQLNEAEEPKAMEIIEHAARMSCNCQSNAPDVEANLHWPSCIIGRAQILLEQKVTVKRD